MRAILILLTAAAAAALTACGGDAPAAEPAGETVTVQFRLSDFDTAYLGCEGAEGYSDIGSGTSVTIKNGSGDVLGAASLGKGKSSSNGYQAAYCDWTVEIPDVPAGEDFYVAEVASRGEITLSEKDLEANDWTFEVSLGS